MRRFISEHLEAKGLILLVVITFVLAAVTYGASTVASAIDAKNSKVSEVVADGSQAETADETAGSDAVDPVESSAANPAETPAANPETTPAETTAPAPSAAEPVDQGTTVNEFGVDFIIIPEEAVTAATESNLRSLPSTESDDSIVTKIFNGDVVVRTGYSENGWSRINYNGQIVYAATNLLVAAPTQ